MTRRVDQRETTKVLNSTGVPIYVPDRGYILRSRSPIALKADFAAMAAGYEADRSISIWDHAQQATSKEDEHDLLRAKCT